MNDFISEIKRDLGIVNTLIESRQIAFDLAFIRDDAGYYAGAVRESDADIMGSFAREIEDSEAELAESKKKLEERATLFEHLELMPMIVVREQRILMLKQIREATEALFEQYPLMADKSTAELLKERKDLKKELERLEGMVRTPNG